MSPTVPQARQASLVAFYGAKPGPLGDFLRTCQDRVRSSIERLGAPASFRPYSLAQIHATVVGLERRDRSVHNRNFDELRGAAKVMRLPALFAFLIKSDDFPLRLQCGGFEDRDYPFSSRGARPYHRSFSLQGAMPVIIGWPVRADGSVSVREAAVDYPGTLEGLRRSAQRFNVLHRWHPEPAAVDNDLYLRLGRVEGDLRESDRRSIEDEIRKALGASRPLFLRLDVGDLCVVSYPADDETLPDSRSRVFRLTDPRLRDEDFIEQLYR